jgi:hypothetical protein
MKKPKQTKTAARATPKAVAHKAAAKPPVGVLLPEDLPRAERIERENDLA